MDENTRVAHTVMAIPNGPYIYVCYQNCRGKVWRATKKNKTGSVCTTTRSPQTKHVTLQHALHKQST